MRQCCKAIVNNSLIQRVAFPFVIAGLFHFRAVGPASCTVACSAEGATPADRQLLPARLRYWSYFADAEVSTTRSISTADVLSSVHELGQFLSGVSQQVYALSDV
jgi:hypothetical protein